MYTVESTDISVLKHDISVLKHAHGLLQFDKAEAIENQYSHYVTAVIALTAVYSRSSMVEITCNQTGI